MEGRLLLDVVVRESSAVLELLSSEDQALLVGRDALLVLDLGLHVVDGVRWLDLEGDSLASERLDEDLHTTAETEDQVEGGLLLNVVIGEGASILELLSSEDEALLIGRNTFLVLDLGLDVVNGVRWLNLEGDSLTSERLNEDLHATAETEDQVESGLLLNVVVGEGSAVLELLSSEDQALLIGRDTLLVLNLSLHVVNSVGWLDFKCDSLASQSLYENLHLDFVLACFWLVFFFFNYKSSQLLK